MSASVTSSPTHKLEVAGDIGAQGFVNLSTREAKRDIEYLTTADYEQVLAKISQEVKVATYEYNSEPACALDSSSPQMRGGQGGELNTSSPNPSSTEEGRNIGCQKRLGLIAEEAPREVLSADGQGVDLYKLATFTLMGVKALDAQVNSFKLEVISLEDRITALEQNPPQPSLKGGSNAEFPPPLGGVRGDLNFQLALETMSGEEITLTQNSFSIIANHVYGAIMNQFRSLGMVIEQGWLKVKNLSAKTFYIQNGVNKAANSIGEGAIETGQDNVFIENIIVKSDSKIFTSLRTVIDRPLIISEIKEGQGFQVSLLATSTQEVKFDWWIVGVQTADSNYSSSPSAALGVNGVEEFSISSNNNSLLSSSPSTSSSPSATVTETP